MDVLNLQKNWSLCIKTWQESRRSDNTRRMYSVAVEDFLKFCGIPIWEASYQNFVSWRGDMLNRKLKGATVNARLDALNSLFTFASSEFKVENEAGGLEPLARFNPVNMKALRVRVKQYANSRALPVSDVKRLLGSIDQTTNIGMRDYALLLGYLNLGRRNTEWRTARICDFEMTNGEVFYRWSGKGKFDNVLNVPADLWKVLNHYISETGGRGPFDYIFVSTRDGKPLSARIVGSIVKKYAKKGGISGRVRVHDLRHTAAMLRRQSGADVEEIRSFLGHSSLVTTQVYLHRLEREADQRSRKIFKLIAVEQ